MSGEQVLVVDDELSMRQFLQILLERDGYRVRTAASGAEALSLADERWPDLVLTDLNMPGMSGLDLLGEIKANYKKPPPVVMMITAYGDDENYNTAIKLGADDFLTKPVDFGVLKDKLKTMSND